MSNYTTTESTVTLPAGTPPWVTPGHAAEILGVPSVWVWKGIRSGQIAVLHKDEIRIMVGAAHVYLCSQAKPMVSRRPVDIGGLDVTA